MEGRTFNAWMPHVNHEWAAKVLNMNLGEDEHRGPDLIDDKKIVEIKFRLLHPNRYTHVHWTTYEHQSFYPNGKPGFWGVGTYRLKEPVEKIETLDPKELEKLVTIRELWIAPWNWMDQFSLYTQRARRNCAWYESDRRYAKHSQLPETTETWKVRKGTIHITRGVDSEKFKIEGKRLS